MTETTPTSSRGNWLDALLMIVVAAIGLANSGCGVQSVSGGTPGTLHGNGTPLSDIQVNVHRLEEGAYRPIGFAVTDNEGRFELVTNGAAGPLRLTEGEYCCTLESVGSPLVIPKDYARTETTPLKFSRTADDGELRLELPAALSR